MRGMADCPHCFEDINERATRCPKCGGEIRNCPRCATRVPAIVREVWKGALRGGRQRQVKCGNCGAVLEGSRW